MASKDKRVAICITKHERKSVIIASIWLHRNASLSPVFCVFHVSRLGERYERYDNSKRIQTLFS